MNLKTAGWWLRFKWKQLWLALSKSMLIMIVPSHHPHYLTISIFDFFFFFFQIFSSNWSKPDHMNRKLASASCWNSASLRKIEEISVVLAATMWTLLSLRMNLALYGINRSIWFIFYLLLCYKLRSWIWTSNGKVSLTFIFYYDFKKLLLFF